MSSRTISARGAARFAFFVAVACFIGSMLQLSDPIWAAAAFVSSNIWTAAGLIIDAKEGKA